MKNLCSGGVVLIDFWLVKMSENERIHEKSDFAHLCNFTKSNRCLFLIFQFI